MRRIEVTKVPANAVVEELPKVIQMYPEAYAHNKWFKQMRKKYYILCFGTWGTILAALILGIGYQSKWSIPVILLAAALYFWFQKVREQYKPDL